MVGRQQRRLVLYPQGEPPGESSRNRCAELVHWCGGDPQRVIARTNGTLEHFARHLTRLVVLRAASEKPLVVYTKTSPPSSVLDARAVLESIVPQLCGAPSIVYVDPASDPDFIEAAADLGEVSGELAGGPLWTTRTSMRFLVVTKNLSSPDLLWPRVEALVLANRAPPMASARRPPPIESRDDDAITPRERPARR
jgi:hypothetical protein